MYLTSSCILSITRHLGRTHELSAADSIQDPCTLQDPVFGVDNTDHSAAMLQFTYIHQWVACTYHNVGKATRIIDNYLSLKLDYHATHSFASHDHSIQGKPIYYTYSSARLLVSVCNSACLPFTFDKGS